jgi:hypothetical protein
MGLVLISRCRAASAVRNFANHKPMDAAPDIIKTSDSRLWRRFALSPLARINGAGKVSLGRFHADWKAERQRPRAYLRF